MASTLAILNNFVLTTDGSEFFGKQGAITDAITDEYESLSVDGLIHMVKGSLATAAVVTVYDDDNDVPADFDYAFIWADQTYYVQVIASATNYIVKCAAKVPYVISGFDSVLAAADTTAITGGSEPSVTDIDSVVIGNYSGSTMKYVCAFID